MQNVQIGAKRTKMCMQCIYIFQLRFHFACHCWWLGILLLENLSDILSSGTCLMAGRPWFQVSGRKKEEEELLRILPEPGEQCCQLAYLIRRGGKKKQICYVVRRS